MAKIKKVTKTKVWSEKEEIELSHRYLEQDMSFVEQAKKHRCTAAEVRKKVKEMGIFQ